MNTADNISVLALAVSMLSLGLSVWARISSRADKRGANVDVKANGHPDQLIVTIHNRSQHKVRVDAVVIWYGTIDYQLVLADQEIDKSIQSAGKHEVLINRSELTRVALEKTGGEPIGYGLLMAKVALQGARATHNCVVQLDQSDLTDHQRNYGLAEHIAANLYLGLRPVTTRSNPGFPRPPPRLSQ